MIFFLLLSSFEYFTQNFAILCSPICFLHPQLDVFGLNSCFFKSNAIFNRLFFCKGGWMNLNHVPGVIAKSTKARQKQKHSMVAQARFIEISRSCCLVFWNFELNSLLFLLTNFLQFNSRCFFRNWMIFYYMSY